MDKAASIGQGQLYEFQQNQVLGPAIGSQHPQAVMQIWGRGAGKWPRRKGAGGSD